MIHILINRISWNIVSASQTTPLYLGFAQSRRHSSLDHLLELLWPDLTSSLTNTDSYDNIYLFSDYLMSSDWAPAQYIHRYIPLGLSPLRNEDCTMVGLWSFHLSLSNSSTMINCGRVPLDIVASVASESAWEFRHRGTCFKANSWKCAWSCFILPK